MRRVVLLPFSCWCCRVLCVFYFVVGVRGGFCLFRHCLPNVCVLRRKVPSQHASPERLLFFVPSSCLVACRRSRFFLGLVMVGLGLVCARDVPASVGGCLCECGFRARAWVLRISWDSAFISDLASGFS